MADIVITGAQPVTSTSQGTPEKTPEEIQREADELALKVALEAFDVYFRTPSVALQKQMSATSLLTVRSMVGQPPMLFPPGCSPESALLLLRPMTLETKNNGIKSASTSMKAQSERKERAQADEVQRVNDWIKAFAESVKNNQAASALKWITRILVPALAVLAVPLTLGAAAPVVALVAATSLYSLAQFASEEAGGPSLSIADNLAGAIAKGLQGAGMSEQDAKHYAMAIGGAVVVVAAVALRQSGGVSGLAGQANNIKTGMQGASLAAKGMQAGSLVAKAATPLMVALDPKLIGNLAGGLTYAVAQADVAVQGKDLSAEEEEELVQTSSIMNAVFTAASQLMVGFTLMRQGANLKQVADLSAKATKATEKGAQMMKAGGVMQDSMTLTNGANSVASGGLAMDTAQKEWEAEVANSDIDRAGLAVDQLDPAQYLALLKTVIASGEKLDKILADMEKRNEQSRQVIRFDIS